MNTLAETTDAALFLWIAEQTQACPSCEGWDHYRGTETACDTCKGSTAKVPVLDIRQPCPKCVGEGLIYAGHFFMGCEPSYTACTACGGKACRLPRASLLATKRQGRGWNPDPDPMRLIEAAGKAGWSLHVGVETYESRSCCYAALAQPPRQPNFCSQNATPYRALLVAVARALGWKENLHEPETRLKETPDVSK